MPRRRRKRTRAPRRSPTPPAPVPLNVQFDRAMVAKQMDGIIRSVNGGRRTPKCRHCIQFRRIATIGQALGGLGTSRHNWWACRACGWVHGCGRGECTSSRCLPTFAAVHRGVATPPGCAGHQWATRVLPERGYAVSGTGRNVASDVAWLTCALCSTVHVCSPRCGAPDHKNAQRVCTTTGYVWSINAYVSAAENNSQLRAIEYGESDTHGSLKTRGVVELDVALTEVLRLYGVQPDDDLSKIMLHVLRTIFCAHVISPKLREQLQGSTDDFTGQLSVFCMGALMLLSEGHSVVVEGGTEIPLARSGGYLSNFSTTLKEKLGRRRNCGTMYRRAMKRANDLKTMHRRAFIAAYTAGDKALMETLCVNLSDFSVSR